jgi:hypothetical protein
MLNLPNGPSFHTRSRCRSIQSSRSRCALNRRRSSRRRLRSDHSLRSSSRVMLMGAKGLNRSRGRGGFDRASERLTTEVLFRKLRSEAFRLVSQPEQSHEGFHSRDFPAASTDAGGHAAAQARTHTQAGYVRAVRRWQATCAVPPIPPRSRICVTSSCTWSIVAPRRSRSTRPSRIEVLLRRDARSC